MQIVIDIPEEMYDWLDTGFPDEDDAEKLWQVVKNGITLPKGHGRIIDESKITLPFFESEVDEKWVKIGIKNAPTIIEADTESEE